MRKSTKDDEEDESEDDDDMSSGEEEVEYKAYVREKNQRQDEGEYEEDMLRHGAVEDEGSFNGGEVCDVEPREKSSRPVKRSRFFQEDFLVEDSPPPSPEAAADVHVPTLRNRRSGAAALYVAAAPSVARTRADPKPLAKAGRAPAAAVVTTASRSPSKRKPKSARASVSSASVVPPVRSSASSVPMRKRPVAADEKMLEAERVVDADEMDAALDVPDDDAEIAQHLVPHLAHVSNGIVDEYVRLLKSVNAARGQRECSWKRLHTGKNTPQNVSYMERSWRKSRRRSTSCLPRILASSALTQLCGQCLAQQGLISHFSSWTLRRKRCACLTRFSLAARGGIFLGYQAC